MRPISKSYNSTGAKEWIPLDYIQTPFNVGVNVNLVGAGTATYGVELTFDNVFDPAVTPVAIPFASIPTGTTADAYAGLTVPCMALRLNVAALSGSIELKVFQGLGG